MDSRWHQTGLPKADIILCRRTPYTHLQLLGLPCRRYSPLSAEHTCAALDGDERVRHESLSLFREAGCGHH
jgi:hypothetical protein